MADATATPETDAPDSAPASAYETKIEDAGPARKRITITVPTTVIQEKIEQSLGTLITQTQLPGFRKGRAPRGLLERRFGPTIRTETKNQVIADSYASAIEEYKIRPVGEPEPVGNLEEIALEDGKPFTFAVEVEVVPEFTMPDLGGIEVKKPMLDVTDEHVEIELRRQCTQQGELESIDSDFREGDRILGPGIATKEGDEEPFFRHDNIDVIVPSPDDGGKGHVLGLLVDGLAGIIEGNKVGDTLTIETVAPEAHEMEDIRGKKIAIELRIREGQRIVPADVARLLEIYGLPSEEILREQVRMALEQRRDQEQRTAMREQVFEHLLSAVQMDLPQKLSAAQVSRMLERQRMELSYRGALSAEEIESRLAAMRAETEEQIANRLKLTFVLTHLAQQFNVQVSEQEVNGRIAQIAAQRRMRPEQLRNSLLQSGQVGVIASQIREHKAADRVIDQANVTEIPATEWNELVRAKAAGEQPAAGGGASGSKKKSTTKKTAAGGSKKKKKKKKTTAKKTASKGD